MHQSSVRPLYIIFMFPSLHFTMLCQVQYFINVFVFIFIAKQSKIDLTPIPVQLIINLCLEKTDKTLETT